MIKQEDIETVLDGLSKSIDNENAELLDAIRDHLPEFDSNSISNFHLKYNHTFDKILRAIVKEAISNKHEVVFLFMNFNYVKNNIQKLIREAEGMSCCADKCRTVINKIADYYINDNKISFDRSQQYTFHLPMKVLSSHDEVLEFYEALRESYAGYPEGIKKLNNIYNKYNI